MVEEKPKFSKMRHALDNPSNNLSVKTHENKMRWIHDIMLKRLEGIPLESEDIKFMLNMQTSMGNDEYAQIIQVMTEALDLQTDRMSKELDAEAFLRMKLGTNQQRINLYKAKSGAMKDSAVERKVNLETINKYAQLAKERGYDIGPVKNGSEIIDNTPLVDNEVDDYVAPVEIGDVTNPRNERSAGTDVKGGGSERG